MSRPRGGKAKRPTFQASKAEDADASNGDDEAVTPAYKRGRLQWHFKTHSDEEDDDNIKVGANMEGSGGTKLSAPSNNGASVENGGTGKKRRGLQSKRGSDSTVEDQKDDEPVKQVGFRQHGSRRKSAPRRAAEAGVEC
jgi:hypothetical protein